MALKVIFRKDSVDEYKENLVLIC